MCINLGTGSLSGSLSLPVHCQCRMLSYPAPTSRKSLNVQVVTTRCDTVMKPCKPVFKRRRRRRSDEERPFRRWVAELQLASVQAQLIGPEQSEQRPMGFCSLNRKQRSNRKRSERTEQTKRHELAQASKNESAACTQAVCASRGYRHEQQYAPAWRQRQVTQVGQGRSQPVGVAVAVEWVAEHGQRRML